MSSGKIVQIPVCKFDEQPNSLHAFLQGNYYHLIHHLTSLNTSPQSLT